MEVKEIETISVEGFFRMAFLRKLYAIIFFFFYFFLVVSGLVWYDSTHQNEITTLFAEHKLIGTAAMLLFVHLTFPLSFFLKDPFDGKTAKPSAFWRNIFLDDYTQVINESLGNHEKNKAYLKHKKRQFSKCAKEINEKNKAKIPEELLINSPWYEPPKKIELKIPLMGKARIILFLLAGFSIATSIEAELMKNIQAPLILALIDFCMLISVFALLFVIMPIIDVGFFKDPLRIGTKEPLEYWRKVIFGDIEKYAITVFGIIQLNQPHIEEINAKIENVYAIAEEDV